MAESDVRPSGGTDLGSGTHSVEHEALQRLAKAAEGRGPFEILFGAGGDPLVFGLPVFVSGSLVVGFTLIGLIPSSVFGGFLPESTFATGIGEFVTALWAIGLGQGIIASIFGLFAAFWFSLFVLILDVSHPGWFGLAAPAGSGVSSAALINGTEQMFLFAWLIIFVFLTVGMFRLPAVYIAILVFVDIAVLCLLLGLRIPADTTVLFMVAGAAILGFCTLGLYAFLEVAWTQTGKEKALLPMGPPIWK